MKICEMAVFIKLFLMTLFIEGEWKHLKFTEVLEGMISYLGNYFVTLEKFKNSYMTHSSIKIKL